MTLLRLFPQEPEALKSKEQQLTELRSKSRYAIISGRKILIAPKGLSVTNKVFANGQYAE